MRVTGLITQGAKRIGSPEYVKSYKVASSDDGKTWRTYKVKGTDGDMVSCVRTHTHAHTLPLPIGLTHAPRVHTHLHSNMLVQAATNSKWRSCTQSRAD